MRKQLSLNGTWRFLADVYGEGETFGWQKTDHDDSTWHEVPVPSTFDQCQPDLGMYEGAAWYRRSVSVPSEWAGKRVAIHFGAVNLHAKVWVNGELAGEHGDGFLPFDLRVDHLLRFGEENSIAVWADNTQIATDVPGTEWGWRNLGGIIRDVCLDVSDLLRLSDVVITAEPEGDGGRFQARVAVENLRQKVAEAGVAIEIKDGEGQMLCTLFADAQTVNAAGKGEFVLEGAVPGAQPWSPDSPVLYTAEIVLSAVGEPVDAVTQRFGFRRVEVRDAQVLLNGKPVYMTGFNRHEDVPGSGLVRDTEAARTDFEEMKAAGCNFVRLCHYPHDEAEVDLCDEMGLLVMCEIPLYWWRGYTVGKEDSLKKLEVAKRQVRKMVARDKNHPSVIIWSVSNECMEDQVEVQEGDNELCRLVKELDPTRLATHVGCYFKTHPGFEEDDVICVNDYPGWGGHGREGDNDRDFVGCTKFWRAELEKLHKLYPSKPIFVTEFGHPSLEGARESGLGEDTQERCIVAEFKGMDAPYMCGALIWCYADHAWPFTAPWVGSLTVSPYGVVTRSRRKLKAFEAIRKMFLEAQGRRQESES